MHDVTRSREPSFDASLSGAMTVRGAPGFAKRSGEGPRRPVTVWPVQGSDGGPSSWTGERELMGSRLFLGWFLSVTVLLYALAGWGVYMVVAALF